MRGSPLGAGEAIPLPATVRSAARFITSCRRSRCCSSISSSCSFSCSFFSYSASIRGLSACFFLHGTLSGDNPPMLQSALTTQPCRCWPCYETPRESGCSCSKKYRKQRPGWLIAGGKLGGDWRPWGGTGPHPAERPFSCCPEECMVGPTTSTGRAGARPGCVLGPRLEGISLDGASMRAPTTCLSCPAGARLDQLLSIV